jgi:hypothetical protein
MTGRCSGGNDAANIFAGMLAIGVRYRQQCVSHISQALPALFAVSNAFGPHQQRWVFKNTNGRLERDVMLRAIGAVLVLVLDEAHWRNYRTANTG